MNQLGSITEYFCSVFFRICFVLVQLRSPFELGSDVFVVRDWSLVRFCAVYSWKEDFENRLEVFQTPMLSCLISSSWPQLNSEKPRKIKSSLQQQWLRIPMAECTTVIIPNTIDLLPSTNGVQQDVSVLLYILTVSLETELWHESHFFGSFWKIRTVHTKQLNSN